MACRVGDPLVLDIRPEDPSRNEASLSGWYKFGRGVVLAEFPTLGDQFCFGTLRYSPLSSSISGLKDGSRRNSCPKTPMANDRVFVYDLEKQDVRAVPARDIKNTYCGRKLMS